MIKKLSTTAALVIVLITACFAADITGKWTGKIMDQYDITYNFKVDGEKLTGSTTGPEGNPINIENGVIKGDEFSFSINIMDNTMKITGKVKDDVITLTMPGMNGGEPMNVILKRAK
ncbi:glycoside hydrolase [Mucilaginibacter psychrotolerans]|uniref:Glycoside hydrolase n=1 Tax=Mucilaginibacter psychrotolerans TaxID=1524096 RepID=A0A4Y8S7Q3_9SPHI|nr:glycoside hydrolase [Mucilaginibacter psychrotolerans]TFF34635.1 glycoside hydrolase [Mucilaginibacter psychrotolerans]